MQLIKLQKVDAGYEKFHVLYNINITIEDKKITTVVGPNGSGKSTLLKCIFGLTNIYTGDIFLGDEKITNQKPHQIARKGISYVAQIRNVFPNLSVRENLLMSGYTLKPQELGERIEEVTGYFPILKECYDRRAGTMSGGERQMLAMAMALLRQPNIMLFDEPTANLSPKIATQVIDEIRKLRDDLGKTIMLVEQNAIKALGCGDKALLLVSGEIAFDGKADDLLNSPELGQMYLGLK
jgi:branched-chain amino acid transport system ATP-binding protein